MDRSLSDTALREYCDKNYHQLLPIIAEKVHQEKVQQEKIKAVKARLNFEEVSQHSESGTPSGRRDLRKRLGSRRVRSMSGSPEPRHGRPGSPRKKDSERKTVFKRMEKGVFHRLGDKGKSVSAYSNNSRRQSYHSSRRDTKSCYQSSRSRGTKPAFEKHHNKRASSHKAEALSKSEAAKVERWAMPTWCHMFNSTLTRSARVWFDDLPPEFVDSYDDLKEAFVANFHQQKKCIKDPVEIHHIKQREGESTEDFVRRFKVESRDVKGAPEIMRISGIMHGITNPELIKRLHDKILKSVDEIMRITTSFLRGEDMFTLLSKSIKEILALEKGKFKAPPPMTTPVKKRNSNKFCEFHGDVGHNTDECMHLKRQIEELLKNGKLSHVIKELKQNSGKDQPKVNKKGETSGKDKALAILMVQSWQRVARQIITQSFSANPEFSFPHLEEEEGTEGPMIIEAEIGGHFIHRMVLTLKSSKIIPIECAAVSGPGGQPPAAHQAIEERIKLCDLLQRNLDVFAWKPADMTGVPRHIAEHRLNIREGCPPVRQKRRSQAADRNQAIQEEVEKLIDADFKDLNKACPKDGYPLPEIDWKVESLCGFPFKCFLDAYKGYHQIKLVKEDEEKTTFITSQGVFCYSKMPFGWRNARATYQRLVDKAFHKQIGRNLEVHMDDLVIKIRTKDKIIRDIEETFKTLKEINMKLNPKKCTFGVEEGMFLGYKVNTKGIKVCTEKVDAVLSLPSPKCLKDVQKLNGKLASLNRFLAKSAEKSLPPRVSVKGQILADFIVKRPEEDDPDTVMDVEEELLEPWILFTDGSFEATNNEAEYEALITGLRIAEEMGVKNLQENVDSRLVANQVNGTYIAKEADMIWYLEKVHKPVPRNLQQNLNPITSLWPFYKRGIDIAEPFPEGLSKVKFLIVAIDYFTKWIEAKPVATITGNQVKKFVWDNIVCRFRLPGEIISDNGKQFRDNPFKEWCEKLCIRQCFASVKHP
ncbi:reverse transcriptase domain-containing protein [Tanacetum coccineum]